MANTNLCVFLLFSLMTCGIYAQDLIAYDCADPNVELSKISLLGVQPCTDPKNTSIEEQKYITLIQRKQYFQVHVYSCLIKVHQLVQYCGIFSHNSAVEEGFISYVHRIKDEECKKMHNIPNQIYNLNISGANIEVQVQPNTTINKSATIKGKLNEKGSCTGDKYSYNGIDYNNVFVTAAITIQLKDYIAVADPEANTLQLRSGLICPYLEHYCFDDEAGEVTWDIRDHSNRCSTNNFDILYKGSAKLLTLIDSKSKYIIVESNNTIFALGLRNQEKICTYSVWLTEQTRLGVIIESSSSSYSYSYRRSQPVIAQNYDGMNQVLSKLLYLQIAMQKQNRDMIYESIKKRCQLREKILQNRLALAYSSPDIVSNLVKEASGHMGRIMGEVLYIVRCVPKPVTYRKTKECYQELPITFENKKQFMAPVSHIIQEHGTEIDCNKYMPSIVYLKGKWVQVNPQIQNSFPIPITLNANDLNETIPWIKINPIDSNGIYTKEEMENFRQTLLFPNQREAISNIVARRITGVKAESQGFRFPKIFDNIEFASMVKKAAVLIWGGFSGLVGYFPTIAMSFLGLALLKYLIGVGFNYFMLKNFNMMTRMAGSLWNSATRLALHFIAKKSHRNQEEQNTTNPDILRNQIVPLIPNSINNAAIV